jgi:hypothetical protein
MESVVLGLEPMNHHIVYIFPTIIDIYTTTKYHLMIMIVVLHNASVQLENVTHVQPDDIVLVAIIQVHVLHVSLVNTIAYWGKLVKALAKSVNEGTTV